jgi:hypothetical protein
VSLNHRVVFDLEKGFLRWKKFPIDPCIKKSLLLVNLYEAIESHARANETNRRMRTDGISSSRVIKLKVESINSMNPEGTSLSCSLNGDCWLFDLVSLTYCITGKSWLMTFLRINSS